MENIPIFDVNKLKNDCIAILIGAKKAGKTEMCYDIVNTLKYNSGHILTSNNRTKHFYSDRLDNVKIQEYDKKELELLIDKQKESVEEMFLIFDNCYDDEWIKNKEMNQLFLNSGDYNLLTLLPMVYPYHIHPWLRHNVDYIFIFRTYNHRITKRLYEMYGGLFKNINVFSKYIQNLDDFEALVIDFQSTKPLNKSIYKYKSDI